MNQDVRSFQDYRSQPAEFVDLNRWDVLCARDHADMVAEVSYAPPGQSEQTRLLYVPFAEFVVWVAGRHNRRVMFESRAAMMGRLDLEAAS